MRHWHVFDRAAAMATRWRRRPLCLLVTADGSWTVALHDIDGRGARIEGAIPPLAAAVELRHPSAGTIGARVCDIGEKGIRLRFDGGEASVAFALAAIAADMTRD